jgi:hypothetical protein
MTLDDPRVDALLRASTIVRVATVAADGTPHAAPFWFAWDQERIVLDTLENRTVRHLRRDPRVQVLADAGERFEDLQGAQIDGHARLHAPDAAPPAVQAGIERLREMHEAETSTDVFAAYAARETRPLVFVEILPVRIAYWHLGRP